VIEVVGYDEVWPALFERLRDTYSRALESAGVPFVAVEHVGSTAVPGLTAKPVIDVMVGVASLAESEPAKDVLRAAAYLYAEYKTDVMHWFCKPSFAFRTHHLHLVPFEGPLWRERLAFRDILRTERAAEDDGLAIVGVMHSHTHSEPYPSPTDVRQAFDPSWHYVIVSLKRDSPETRSFHIEDGAIVEEPIARVES